MYAADGDFAVLQRLAQHLERIAGELGQLVQKQHAVVRQTDLAGAGDRPAAHNGCRADAVVRAAEGPLPDKPRAAAQQPGHGIDGACLERLLVGQRRQNARQPLGKHGFSCSGTPDHDQIMPARRGDLHGAAGFALAAHVGHVRPQPDAVLIVPLGRCRGQGRCAAEVQHHVLRTAGRVDGQALGHGGLGGVFGGQKQLPHAVLHRGQRHRQHAGHGAQRAVQPQLAQKRPLTAGGGQLALRGHDAHKHRQIVHRPGLAHVGGGQIDGDAAGGPLIVQVLDGTAHPLTALLHGGVRQTHQIELRQPARKVGFDLHDVPRQTGHAEACHFCIHGLFPTFLLFYQYTAQRALAQARNGKNQAKLNKIRLTGLQKVGIFRVS